MGCWRGSGRSRLRMAWAPCPGGAVLGSCSSGTSPAAGPCATASAGCLPPCPAQVPWTRKRVSDLTDLKSVSGGGGLLWMAWSEMLNHHYSRARNLGPKVVLQQSLFFIVLSLAKLTSWNLKELCNYLTIWCRAEAYSHLWLSPG